MTTMVEERPQHLRALESANRIRLTRASHVRGMEALGSRMALSAAADFIEGETPDWAESWALGDYLRRLPRMGRTRTRKFITAAGFTSGTYNRPLGNLTTRQREAMGRYLRMKAEGQR